jgi:SRSO17 transposase
LTNPLGCRVTDPCVQNVPGHHSYVSDQPPAEGFTHTLLIRRSVADPAEIEFFLAHAPDPTPIPELIAVAGMRWKIEENNAQGKDLLGLDQYQVRKWTPWHRHVTACMLAHAFLAATRAQLGKDQPLLQATAC